MDNADNRRSDTTSNTSPKKNPPSGRNLLRFLCAGCALYGAFQLLGGLLSLILPHILTYQINRSPSEAAAIGIIGGADGPTAIWVASPPWTSYIIPAALLIAGVWGFFRTFRRR